MTDSSALPHDIRTVADQHIPLVREAFSGLGPVRAVAPAELNRAAVREATILAVRSVTKVNAELLDGSLVRFVGTATIGTDHIDVDYLDRRGIGFASAPGSNANSVAEYVVAVMLHLAEKKNLRLPELTLGIVGVGHIGSLVRTYARALGMRSLLNDPPRERRAGSAGFSPLAEVLRDSDIITVHVPLTYDGQDPTHCLISREFLRAMKKGAILINSSRGPVHDEQALAEHRDRLGALALDVWENEPSVSPDTVLLADIATPHVAGYSYDGRVRAVEMISRAACEYFSRNPAWAGGARWDGDAPETVDVRGFGDPVAAAVRHARPVLEDHARLVELVGRAPAGIAAGFAQLRSTYPCRREFGHYCIVCSSAQEERCGRLLRSLGFGVEIG